MMRATMLAASIASAACFAPTMRVPLATRAMQSGVSGPLMLAKPR